MPGTPLRFLVPDACRPFQSFTFVWPVTVVPAVVRSSRQADFCASALGTSTRCCPAQWAGAATRFSAPEADGTAATAVVASRSTAEAARGARRVDWRMWLIVDLA